MAENTEQVLTESRTMRAATVERTDVLTKVKALALLPDGVHATTELVAGFYEVDAETIKKLVQRNRDELTENGMRVVRGPELRAFKESTEGQDVPLSERINALTLFTRRTVLNVGQLLTGSEVAHRVREYLLNVEESASTAARSEAVDRAEFAALQMRVLAAAGGIVDAKWLELKARHVAARALGEEPEVAPEDRPLYVPDFLRGKGLKKADVLSVQSWFGRRAAALYEAEHGERPGMRTEDTERGSVRETVAWTYAALPVFEETWNRYYAAQFPQAPTQLSIAGGAA
ncbi:ORF6N domain-containing protein [Kitasatospora aureofaciens]|uniref:ORF6N domain-containing protein n=1 Tax=Kitasatospora aureofaciens TaxID=1894 RepID=UPI001C482418|nr:ORF6N domain-containing protein [Kitasatospora aureofaciens]